MAVNELVKLGLDLLCPVLCRGCGQLDYWLCPDCLSQVPVNPNFFCPGCFQPSFFGHACFACRDKSALDGLWLVTGYKQPLIRELVEILKYRFIEDAALPLSVLLIRYLKNILSKKTSAGEFDFVMPVPLSRRRYLWRGFNQAALLAKPTAQAFSWEFRVDLLARQKFWRPQTRKKKIQRQKSVAGAFRVHDPENALINKRILLIDDVVTTGATLNAAAHALKRAGVSLVWGLALAKG